MDYRYCYPVNVEESIRVLHVVEIDNARGIDNLLKPKTHPELCHRIGDDEFYEHYDASCTIPDTQLILDYAKKIGKFEIASRYIEWAKQQEGLSLETVYLDKSPEEIRWVDCRNGMQDRLWRNAIRADHQQYLEDKANGLVR